MKWFLEQIRAEPTVFGEVVRSFLLLLILFGVTITEQQLAGIMMFIGLVITFFTRRSVTPNTKVDTHVTVTRTGVADGMGITTKETL